MYWALITQPVVICIAESEPEGAKCVPFWYSYVVYPAYSRYPDVELAAFLGYN